VKGLKYEGVENIPETGAVIIAPNHKSNFDPPLIGICSPRIVHYMAKEELFEKPILAPILRFFGTFPVKRGSIDRSAIRQAMKEIKNGEPLGIFPEGTRVRGNKIGRFHDGMASLALMTGTPILPVAVLGSEMFPKKKGPLAVIFGKPILVTKQKTSPEAIAELNERVRESIVSMREEYYKKCGYEM
jgi:1-acyl-sn-glycerol-3-phosphate acyltransferase